MGRLFLIHDFSPTRPWLYALLNANRKTLADQGLVFGPFNPFSTDWQLTHEHYFRNPGVARQPGANVAELWNRLGKLIATERDILLFTHRPHLEAYAGFASMLAEYTALNPRDIRQLFIIAQPARMLELRFREFKKIGENDANALVASYGRLLMLTDAAEQRIGADNVRIIANFERDIRSRPDAELGAKVFSFLGRDCNLDAADDFLFPTRFQSGAARALSRMGGVRWNTWKQLDQEAYVKTLSILDERWGEEFASPLALRKMLTQKSSPQMALLEKKLGLDSGSLSPEPELLAKDPASNTDEIAPTQLEEFAEALPPQAREQLIARFNADEALLSARQKQLLQALCPAKLVPVSATPGEFTQIGDTEPPVELTVLTMAYNHEKYIAECMDSILMQKTAFPVRHIVLDHNSSDGTQAIIRDYAAKHPSIQPVLLSRRVPEENVRGLFLRCRTKYAALCDGDDYFFAPDKLQKQVDYLEARPHCALSFHPVAVTFEDGTKPFRFPPVDMLPLNKKMEFHLAQLTKHNFIQTNSVVYRWRFRDGLPAWFRSDICPGDWYWHMLHAETGRIGYLPETMSVYRRHKNALYNDAFKSADAHWRNRGLAELKAYQACNDHFKDRYFKNFSTLASGIFAAFLRISEQEGDSSLLDMATQAYPRLALDFYQSVNKILD